MRHSSWWVLVVPLLALQADGGVPESEFAARRARLAALADSGTAFILRAADMRMRSGDVNFPYRQESNFYYLTGLSEPGISVLVVPGGWEVEGQRRTSFLFVPSTLPSASRTAEAFQGGMVLPHDRLPGILDSIAGTLTSLYVSMPDVRFTNDWLNNRPLFLDQEARQRFQEGHPGIRVRNAATYVGRLRECKSPAEIECIRNSIRVTGEGIRRAIALCRPGVKEYELQAAIEYAMTLGGAQSTSFPSIIGSGENSLIPHYDKNRRTMQPGDVVVMDVGAELDGYAADITRTIPVSGVFTAAQKKMYEAVLRSQEEVIAIIRPGVRWAAIEAKARDAIASAGFGGRMTHGVSHHLGLDAHDAGGYDTLKAGMVITVEPGVYIQSSDTAFAPAFRGYGIRIEDDVLVSETGAIVLSSEIPKSVRAIEDLMKRRNRSHRR